MTGAGAGLLDQNPPLTSSDLMPAIMSTSSSSTGRPTWLVGMVLVALTCCGCGLILWLCISSSLTLLVCRRKRSDRRPTAGAVRAVLLARGRADLSETVQKRVIWLCCRHFDAALANDGRTREGAFDEADESRTRDAAGLRSSIVGGCRVAQLGLNGDVRRIEELERAMEHLEAEVEGGTTGKEGSWAGELCASSSARLFRDDWNTQSSVLASQYNSL